MTAKEAGQIKALKLNLPCPTGIEFGAHLARFVEVEVATLEDAGRPVPEMCGSCAFRRGTLPNGCLTTLADAFKCVMEQETFLCHEEEPIGRACGGWAILRGASPKDSGPVEMPWGYSTEGD